MNEKIMINGKYIANRLKHIIPVWAVVLVLSLLLTSCEDAETGSSSLSGEEITNSAGSAEDDGTTLDYTDIVDEHAEIFLALDSDGYLFDMALDTIGEYLSGNISDKDALETVDNTISEMQTRQESIRTYTVDDQLGDVMDQYGIQAEEFEIFGNSRSSQLSTYISSLESLTENLQYVEEYDFEYEEVEFWYEAQTAIQDAYRGYYYYGSINYWFAEWDDEQVDYVKEQVIDKLRSYRPSDAGWEIDRDAAETKTMLYLDDMDDVMDNYSEHLAEMEEELNSMKQELP